LHRQTDAALKEKSKKIAASIKGITKVVDTEEGFTAVAQSADQLVPQIVRAFDQNTIPLASVSFASPSLDDVFLQRTGRRIRSEELQKKPDYAFAKMPKKRKIPFH
jgi:ABC-2 type transport system ATP-binding protein